MAVCGGVVERLDDDPSLCHISRDYSSTVLHPLSVQVFEAMGVDPSFDNVFVLSVVRSPSCSCEQAIGKYHNILVVAFARVMVLSSGQCVCPSVLFPL